MQINNNALSLRDRETSQLKRLRKYHYIDVSTIVYHALIRLVCLSPAETEVFVYHISLTETEMFNGSD